MTRSEKHEQQVRGTADPGGGVAYTIARAVAVSGRSRSRIFQAIKDGELQARKDGRSTIITDAELRRWINAMPTIGRIGAEVPRHA